MQNLEYNPDESKAQIAEKQMRAMAFLIQSYSDSPRRPLGPCALVGLAEMMKFSADDLAGVAPKPNVA